MSCRANPDPRKPFHRQGATGAAKAVRDEDQSRITEGTSWCGGVVERVRILRLLPLAVLGVLAVQGFRIRTKSPSANSGMPCPDSLVASSRWAHKSLKGQLVFSVLPSHTPFILSRVHGAFEPVWRRSTPGPLIAEHPRRGWPQDRRHPPKREGIFGPAHHTRKEHGPCESVREIT